MDSESIKGIVAKVNFLCESNNTNSEELLEHYSDIMSVMIKTCAKSPTFAVAIIQHLNENGHELLSIECPESSKFREKFLPHVEKLGEKELINIKKISTKLFS